MRVFVSYAPDDEDLKNDLLKHLGPAIRAGVLSPWDSSKVMAGDEKSTVSEAELGRADVALVLLSAGYLDTGGPADRDLVRIAARRTRDGLRVVPIVLSPCDWQTEARIKDLQVLPRDGLPIRSRRDREAVLVEVCREIVALGTAASAPGPANQAGKPLQALASSSAEGVAGTRPSSQGTLAQTPALNWRDPGSVLSAAVAAVPVMKYALGVAGLAAVVAIVTRGFGLDAGTATVGTLVVLALMATLIVLGVAARQERRLVQPAMVLTWAVLMLALCSSALLLMSLFFQWPQPLRCLFHDEQCVSAKRRGDEGADRDKATGAAPLPAPVSAAPRSMPPAPTAAVKPAASGAASVEVNSDNVIEDSPGGEMHNSAVIPPTKGPARLNSGNRMKGSKGAKMDNRIQVTP